MILKTSTVSAPWTIIEGNCKWHARVQVLSTMTDRLSQELNFDPFAEKVTPQATSGKAKKKKGK